MPLPSAFPGDAPSDSADADQSGLPLLVPAPATPAATAPIARSTLALVPGSITTAAGPAAGPSRLSAWPVDPSDPLSHAVKTASDVPPETAARVFQQQLKTGLPHDVISRNLDSVEKASAAADFDPVTFRQQSPLMADWLTAHPLHAAVAQDDTSKGGQPMDHLGALDWLVAMPGRAVAQAINEERASSLRGTALLRDLTPAENDQLNAYSYHATVDGTLGAGDSWFKGALTKSMKLLTALTVPEALPTAAGLLLGGAVGSIVPGAGTIAGATAGAEAGYTYGLGKSAFLTSAGSSYDQYSKITDATGAPLDPHVAKLAALANGAINAGLMVVGGKVIGSTIAGASEKVGSLFTRDAIATALKNPTVVARLGALAGSYATTMTEGVALMAAMQAGDILVSEIAKTTGNMQAEHAAAATPDYGYGNRFGTTTPKGLGFLGPLQRADGSVMSEYSIGVNIDGKEHEIPSLVPTLTKEEVQALVAGPDGAPVPAAIQGKAIAYAKARLAAGKDPFAGPGEQQALYPELARAAAPTPKPAARFAHRTVPEAAGEIGKAAADAVQSFALIAGAGPALGLTHEALRAARGQVTPQFVEALGEGVAQSKAAARAPGAVEDLITRSTHDQTWYLPVESLTTWGNAQREDPAALAARLTGKPDALAEAQRTGTDLAVTPARYATVLAGTEHNAFFKNELRLGPAEMNGRESADWLAEQTAKAAEPPAEPAAPTAVDVAHQALVETQTDAGTSPDVAETNAALVRAAFGTTSDRAGVDPLTEYQRRGITVQRPETPAASAEPLGAAEAPTAEVQAGAPVATFSHYGPSGAQFDFPLPDGTMSTGDAATVTAAGFTVPDVPADTGDRATATAARDAAQARETARQATRDAVGRVTDTAPVERRLTTGEAPGGVERRAVVTAETPPGFSPQQSIAERAAALRLENPNIDAEAAAVRAKAAAAGRIPEPPRSRPESPLGQAIVDSVQAASAPVVDVRVDKSETPAQTEARYAPEPASRADTHQSWRPGERGVAPSRPRERETPRQFAARKIAHFDAVYTDVLDAARQLDPTIDATRLRDEFDFRLQTLDELQQLDAESGHDPFDLLRAIDQAGGIGKGKGEGSIGEIAWLKDGLKFGAVRDPDNKLIKVFRAKSEFTLGNVPVSGHELGGMLEILRQEPRFQWLDNTNMLVDAIGAALRERTDEPGHTLPGTDELRSLLQIKTDEQWWRNPWNPTNMRTEAVDTADSADRGDTSFDFGANVGDVLDTGEVQSRLPGDVGDVRDETRATPEIPLPFALMSETEPAVASTAADLPLGDEPVKTLFQEPPPEQQPRAAITIGPDRKVTISLFAHADLTSFLHESGHLFLEVLGDLRHQVDAIDPAERTPQQAQLVADHQTLLGTLGVESADQITRAHHEELAHLFTDYLKEGKAPSVALQPAFARFRAWLLDVYKALRQAKTPLTDDVRRVFDRLLASDQAIADAEARRGQPALFATPEEAGMTPARFAVYRETIEAAHREAQQTLDQQLLQDVRREQTAQWKADQARIQTQVTKELGEQPVYKALAAMRHGAHPDGSPLIEGQAPEPITLSRGLVADRYPRLNVPRDLLSPDGRDPDLVAELVGYPSGGALLKAIAEATPLKRAIAEETRARLWQQHGSTLLDGTLPEKADAAVSNDRRADVVRAELTALWAKADPEASAAARRGDTHAEQERAYERRWFEAEAKLRIAIAEGHKQVEIDRLRSEVQALKAQTRGAAAAIRRGIPSEAAIKAAAQARIDSLPLRDLKPAEFWAAARRASQAAVDHTARQDVPAAITAKTQELVSLAHYRAADAARTAIDEALTTFQQLNKPDATIAATRNLDLVQAARAVLGTVGLGRRPPERLDSYLTQLKTYDPDLHASLLDQIHAATPADAPRDYRDLSYGAFKALSESVDALWNLARSTEQIDVGGEKLVLADVRTQILDKLHEFSEPRAKAGYTEAVSAWDRVKVGLLGFRARGRRVEDWVTVVDNGREGIARRAVYDPINAGGVAYDAQRVELAKQYAALAERLDTDTRVTKIAAPELNYTFTSKHQDLLGALLHTGNGFEPGSNGDKLLRGREWTKAGWDTFLDRMQREGVLTKSDYDFVQGVWDLQESLKPAAQAVHKDRFGRYFDEVTAVPVDTPWGSYRGGYYPAIADPFITPLAADRAEANSLLEGGGGGTTMFPSVGRGFTQTRTEGYAKPLILDASQVLSHVNSVLRFIHLSGPVHDVARLILHPQFRGALDAVDPAAVSDLLVPYLQRAARQTMFTPLAGKGGRLLDAAAREVRNRGSMQIIALNATVLAEQFTHFPSVLVHPDVDAARLLGGLWQLSRGPQTLLTEIHEASPYMATRESAGLVEAHEAINRILLDPNPAQRGAAWVQDHSTVLMRGIQTGMDAATWHAVYGKLMDTPGVTHDQAVARADAAVRQALGSYRPQDRSALEGGSQMVGLLNQFYGFFNTKLNMLGTEAALASRMGLQRRFARGLGVYTFGFLIPAMLGEGIKNAMQGKSAIDQGPDDDAAVAAARFWGVSQLKMGARMIPFGGPLLEAGVLAFGKGRPGSVLNAPSIQMVTNAIMAPGHAVQALTDTNTRTHAQNAKTITDFFTMLGMLSNLPMRPVGQAVNVAHDYLSPE